ncbi:MAG: cbb3-type cytochrome oxidase subunit 3 [Parasphingorhabdus sp.]|jgi:cbb3-type cytochrome oxidase subunit 3
MSSFHLFWTIALVIMFVCIIIWAWSGARTTDFEEASRLPFDDGDDTHPGESSKGTRHV